MAREFVLLSSNEYKRLRSLQQPPSKDPQPQPPTNDSITIIEDKQENNQSFDYLITLLPKQYQNRAKSILLMLKPDLNAQGRITYPDGTESSHLIDLLKVIIAPSHFRKRLPPDTAKFMSLLENADIPKSLYNAPPSNDMAPINDNSSRWLTFD